MTEEKILLKTDKCTIVKREEKILAKCGDTEQDLGLLPQPQKDEECPECAEAVAVGWAISYVQDLNPQKAQKIYEDVADEKISSSEALDKCSQLAQEYHREEIVDSIKGLKDLMRKPISELEGQDDKGNL